MNIIFILLLLVALPIYGNVGLKIESRNVTFKADLQKYLQDRDEKRLKSGLLNRVLVIYKLIDQDKNIIVANGLFKLFQYDLWKDKYIEKIIFNDLNSKKEYEAKKISPKEQFLSFDNLVISSVDILKKNNSYKLLLYFKINPLTEKQLNIAQKQISRFRFSSFLPSNKDENNGASANTKEERNPFLGKIMTEYIQNVDEELVVESDWIKWGE